MAAGNTYTPIATQTLGSTSGSVTFSSISGAYTDLVLIVAGTINSATAMDLTFNSDTGSNYSRTILTGDGSSASSSRVSSATNLGLGFLSTTQSVSIIQLMNYSNTTTYKTVISRGNVADNRTTATVGLWRSTAAITTINLAGGTYQIGTTFSLYGIAAA